MDVNVVVLLVLVAVVVVVVVKAVQLGVATLFDG